MELDITPLLKSIKPLAGLADKGALLGVFSDGVQKWKNMRCYVDSSVLFIHKDDVPPYKKQGSVVRNSYFWALKSISDTARFDQAWEFEQSVWIALCRLLTSFAMSGYLGDRETLLEFPPDAEIPEELRAMSTWAAESWE